MAIQLRPSHETSVIALAGLVLVASVFFVWLAYEISHISHDNKWWSGLHVLAYWWLLVLIAWNARRRFKRRNHPPQAPDDAGGEK